jgi:hypothetical protein
MTFRFALSLANLIPQQMLHTIKEEAERYEDMVARYCKLSKIMPNEPQTAI